MDVRCGKEGFWGGVSGRKKAPKWEKRNHITGTGGNLV